MESLLYSITIFLVIISTCYVKCGENCAKLNECLRAHGAESLPAILPDNADSVTQHYHVFCRNIDVVLNCFSPSVFKDCSTVSGKFNYTATKREVTMVWNHICPQVDDYIDLVHCVMKPVMTDKMRQCVDQTKKYVRNASKEEVCQSPFFEEYSSCMVRQMTGICSETTIALFRGYCEIEKIVLCPTEDDR